MPTPFDLLRDPATQVLLAMFAGLLLWEFAAPGRPLPHVPGWTVRALASFVVYFLFSSYLPLLWGEALAPLQWLDLSVWPRWGAVAAAVVGYEFAVTPGTDRCIASHRCGGFCTRCTTARNASTSSAHSGSVRLTW